MSSLTRLLTASRWFPSPSAPVLFIVEQNTICRSQVYPYHYYRRRLKEELAFTFAEVQISKIVQERKLPGQKPDIVFLQPWFDIDPHNLSAVFRAIRIANPVAKIVFLDSFAPLDVRFATLVNGEISAYVKKHVFRDRREYGRPTRGDTNLVDYYGRLFGMDYPETAFPVPNGFLGKLIVGPSFLTADFLLPFLDNADSGPPSTNARSIDLHARLGGGEVNNWYGKMRSEATRIAHAIKGIRIQAGPLIGHGAYMKELRSSKICFSPFGYGEVCWRDYEAALSGALIVKPDMGHVETDPDIFRPFETYVPIRWDFQDLEEKVRHFLENTSGRETITRNAYKVLRDYCLRGDFVNHVRRVLNKLS